MCCYSYTLRNISYPCRKECVVRVKCALESILLFFVQLLLSTTCLKLKTFHIHQFWMRNSLPVFTVSLNSPKHIFKLFLTCLKTYLFKTMGFKDHNIFNNMYFLKAHHLPGTSQRSPHSDLTTVLQTQWETSGFTEEEAETPRNFWGFQTDSKLK